MNIPQAFQVLPAKLLMTERASLKRYEVPERGERGHTDCVLLPRTEQEVCEILSIASRNNLQLVVSAGRTGLVEAQRPEGEGVLSLERLQSPKRLRLADGQLFSFSSSEGHPGAMLYEWWNSQGRPSLVDATLEVEAGITIDEVNRILEPVGFMWPLEMGSSSAATIGACIANASAGANAICYGTAAHLCQRAWGVWADGTEAGPFEGPIWVAPHPDRLAIDSTRIDPALGLIGSQGLFGVITRADLRLYPRPRSREAALVPVADMDGVVRLLRHAQDFFSSDIEEFEFIGRSAMDLVLAHLGSSAQLPFSRDRLRDWSVLIQVKSAQDGDDLTERLYNFLVSAGIADEDMGYAPLPALKSIRHSITEASNAAVQERGGGRLSFDTAVPIAFFGDYLDTLAAQLRADWPGIDLIAFGHAGVGGVHLHLLGSREQNVTDRKLALIDLVFDVTGDFNGTFSAEHGVGTKWGREFMRRAPAQAVKCLRQEKHRHDPHSILNPRSFGLSGLSE